MPVPTCLRPAEVSDLPFIFGKELEYMETIEPGGLQGWMSVIDRNLADWIDCLPHSLFCVYEDGRPLGYAMWTIDAAAYETTGEDGAYVLFRKALGEP